MGAINYLYRRTLINRIRLALRKPVTYFYIAFILLYAFMIPYSFRILLYAHLRTLVMQMSMNLFVALMGALLFHVVWWKMVIYFVFSILIENVLECGIMMLLYGTEKLGEKGRKNVVTAAYALLGMVAFLGILAYIKGGLSMDTVLAFLHSDSLQLVPVIGWYIAVIHLLFTGPTVFNLFGTAAYAIFLIVICAAAFRMRCTGGYYEDAIKFAEDYEEILETRKQGRTDKKFGKKQKFGKAKVAYQGTGAKALFYRQLLEYKKNKYFIFDVNTVVCLVAGIAIAYLYHTEGGFGGATPFVIPGVSAYIIFCFSALTGKWGKELTTPYTYLIPDSPIKKLWYATAMQHIQAVVCGILITIPGAVMMKQSLLTSVLCVVFYVILNANKLYALTLAEAIVGNVLGRTAKSLLQLFMQGIVILFAFGGALAGMLLESVDLAYVLMIAFLTVGTAIFMLAATLNFYKLETI